MRRFIAALAAAALLFSSLPVYAGSGWRYGDGYSKYRGGHTVYRYADYGRHKYKPYYKSHKRYGGSYRHRHYRKRHHRDDDVAFALLGGLLGGVVIGSVLAQPRYAPPPAYAPPRFTHCVPTTGVRYQYGREALYGGTMCYDHYGRGFIRNDSVHFLYYLD